MAATIFNIPSIFGVCCLDDTIDS